MKLKKTMYDLSNYYPAFKNSVLYVGFQDDLDTDGHMLPWLDKLSVFAGYDDSIFKSTVSQAKKFLETAVLNESVSVCIVNARYSYKDDKIPIEELPFCTLDGLSYYQRRKRPVKGFFQGFQFIKQLAPSFPNISFAIYGGSFDGITSQAKEMKVDFIPALSSRVYVPFTVMEYLRNENESLFVR